MICYLNIDTKPDKIADLRILRQSLPLVYLVLTKTKLEESFSNDGYEIPDRRNRDKSSGGLTEFVIRWIICKKNFKLSYLECICSEFEMSESKWLSFSGYRPLDSSNLPTIFEEISVSLNKAIIKYQTIIIMGDFI